MAELVDLKRRAVAGRVQTASFSEATGATHEIAAAAVGKRHYVLDCVFDEVQGDQRIQIASAANVLAEFEFGATPSVGKVDEHAEDGDFLWRTNPGEALNVILDAAVQVSGYIRYVTFETP